MKVSMLTALESPGARAQQIARQMFVYGRAADAGGNDRRGSSAIDVDDVASRGRGDAAIAADGRRDRPGRQGVRLRKRSRAGLRGA